MGDKNLLITSMQKLINHVKKSIINQQQIFYSLSRNDFKKILTNLQEKDIMLRKTSLNLIIELLTNNNQLKKKFCKTMDINLIPGKILLNSKILDHHINKLNMKNIISLLKKQPISGTYLHKQEEFDCVLWYIDLTKTLLEVKFIWRDYKNTHQQINIDPQQCLIGFCLSTHDIMTELSTTNLSTTSTTVVPPIQKKTQLKNLIQTNPKNIIPYIVEKASTLSQNQPRYQRMHKSIQMQTDRPKKILTTYQPFVRKNNQTYKGNQTERYNVNTSVQIQDNFIKRESFEIEKSRPSMPVKINQAPYVPMLNIQQGYHNFESKTNRASESFSANNNRPKDFDFQKVKYQGIKVTANQSNVLPSGKMSLNSSINNNHTLNSGKITQRKQIIQNGFKYIKPMTVTHQQGIKYVGFFPNKRTDQIKQKKTIDVFQYIKNR